MCISEIWPLSLSPSLSLLSLFFSVFTVFMFIDLRAMSHHRYNTGAERSAQHGAQHSTHYFIVLGGVRRLYLLKYSLKNNKTYNDRSFSSKLCTISYFAEYF